MNAETPRVKFKNSAEEDRRGRARNVDGGNREQNKDLLMKEGGKGGKDGVGGKGEGGGGNCTRITYGERVTGTQKSPFYHSEGRNTRQHTHIPPAPHICVCLCVLMQY